MKSLLLFTLLSLISASKFTSCGTPSLNGNKAQLTSLSPCNAALWQRTYGAMDRFAVPPERSLLKHRCVLDVRGKLTRLPLDMQDGDVKIWFDVEETTFLPVAPQPTPYDGYQTLLRPEFFPAGKETMAAEVVCAAEKKLITTPGEFKGLMSPVKDMKNINGIRVCKDYTDAIFAPWRGKLKTGDEVYFTGELIKDTGPCGTNDGDCHGHMEIHPVSLMRR
jgi:hypothetical protein